MRLDTTRLNNLGMLGAILGQNETPAIAPAPSRGGVGAPMSYQRVWDTLQQSCAAMIGEEQCVRLLGRTCFICPPPTGKPATEQWWFWLGCGIVGGVIVGKFFQ